MKFVVREWSSCGGPPQGEIEYENVEEAFIHLDNTNSGVTSFARLSVKGFETFVDGFIRLPLKRGNMEIDKWKGIVEKLAKEMGLETRLNAEVSWRGHAEIRFFKPGPRPVIRHCNEEGESQEVFPCLMVWID